MIQSIGISLEYELSYEEILEGFYCFDSPREGRVKTVQVWTLCAVGCFCLACFMLRSGHIHYFLLSVFALITALSLVYYLPWRRRRNARKLSRLKGVYRINIMDGIIRDGNGNDASLSGKHNRFFEGPNVFVLSLERCRFYCVPKRALTAEEAGMARRLFQACCPRYQVVTM